MTVPGNIDALLLGGQRGYQIERSLRFNSADSAYLELLTGGTAGNQTTWTFSCWVKRSKLGTVQHIFNPSVGGDSSNESLFRFETSDKIRIYDSGTTRGDFVTTQVFRDTSAWYHIAVALDTTQGTSTNRFKLYVNGVQITTFDTASYPGSSVTWGWNRASTRHRIGAYAFPSTASNFGDFYLTEIHHIDGQALTPSSFGETDTITGVWKPKRYAGTYGANGFYLKFADNSGTTSTTLGKDSSGNGNNWTPNNFSVTAGAGNDSLIDTPTPYADGGNGRGNYCTLNPLDSTATLSNGNLTQTATAERSSRSTFQIPSTGLWYAEATATSTTNGSTISCGFGLAAASVSLTANPYSLASAWNLYSSNAAYINRNGTPSSSLGFTLTAGDVVQIAVDPANNRAWIGRNNTWYDSGTGTTGNPSSGTNPTVSSLPAGLFVFANTFNQTWDVNFGQRAFAYTPPSGFKALNTQNLPEPSIKKPSTYMDVLTWTGNATYPRAITGLNFSPDLIWLKSRSNAYDNVLMDAVRGTGNTKWLSSNLTDAEGTNSNNANVSSLDSAGFTIGTTGGTNILNASGVTNVAWCWDESATPGFDIVTYTGNGTNNRAINHGLGVTPAFIVVKDRTNTFNWDIYHQSLGINATLTFTTDATRNLSAFGTSAPTSTQFFTQNNFTNTNAANLVAYLWSEVAGFSKFGSYTGNGSSDGSFVFCGFRPKVVWFKRTDSTGSWFIEDSARGTYNAMGPELYANSADAETTVTRLDFLSNGFKMRAANAGDNASGGTYIFCAWAESPFKYSLAR